MPQPEILATLLRNGRVESEHRGSIAVVDCHGSLVAHVGDPYQKIYLRSCAKPFQALPVVSSGAKDRFGFSEEELAVMAGSHSGEEIHVKAVQSILAKIGLTEKSLLCGAHTPHPDSVLHNNCSGKHAGMLAVAVDMGLSPSDYLEYDHPVQKIIRDGLFEYSGVNNDDYGWAVDGCSAPTFYMPLVNLARAYARLASLPDSTPQSRPSSPNIKSIVGSGRTWSRSDALGFVASAMMNRPQMVAGTGRLDTEVMKTSPGLLLMKGGAEGVQGIGVVKAVGYASPLGIAFKISDGCGRRAMGPVSLDVLNQLGVIKEPTLISLNNLWNPLEKNHRGTIVGEIKIGFRLRF